jgi:hypothetical protein
LDINDGIGLSQFAAQAVIFLGELEHTAILGLGGINLAPALLRCQRGALIGSTLLAPSGQVGGVNAFFAQQGSNLTRLPPMSGYLSPLNLNKEVRHETKI